MFVELPNTKIELLHPLGEPRRSPGFLEKNPAGGMHHVCYEVDDILGRPRPSARPGRPRARRRRAPRIGAHGKPVLFLHPKDFAGTLVELEQA